MSGPEGLEFPANWDVLPEPVDPSHRPERDPSPPAATARLAASLADLLLLLVGTAAGVAAASLGGLPVSWRMVPFAAAAAALAWAWATVVLLVVRRSWPGALLVGCAVPERPDLALARRWVPLLLVAALLLGVPALLAGARGPWRGLGPASRVTPSGA